MSDITGDTEFDAWASRWRKNAEEAREQASAEDIIARFTFIIEYKLHIDETLKVVTAIRDHLVEQLKTISNPADRLAIARQARAAYEQAARENWDAYQRNAIEKWEPRHALCYYGFYPEKRPADSKYSLEQIEEYGAKHEKPRTEAK